MDRCGMEENDAISKGASVSCVNQCCQLDRLIRNSNCDVMQW